MVNAHLKRVNCIKKTIAEGNQNIINYETEVPNQL